jgi:hypothetical protein
MVFFHPYVRRVFFDARDDNPDNDDAESLLRVYTMSPPAGSGLYLEASDAKGRSARPKVTDLRLFLFANGIGILSIGVEAHDVPASEALWINEAMRKVYASSSRQLREGRAPNRIAFSLESGGNSENLVTETFAGGTMIGFLPPLGAHIQSLLYFANYNDQEFEPVLDERMIVFTYCAIDPASVPPDFIHSPAYNVLLSRLLWVDRWADKFRYDPEFSAWSMSKQLYRRWAHYGTWYGFTSYSNITCCLGEFDCGEHQLREGFLIHRMFRTRYYLMAMVALFYRATLLEFAERTALVSRRLYNDMEDGRLNTENVRLVSDLRAEFLHFSNYWYFDELANKDEEIEHFTMHCDNYRIYAMKRDIEEEVGKLNDSLHNYQQFRNTESINRLAMLSMILGAGAVATGFFGMNFGGEFGNTFFAPTAHRQWFHWAAMVSVTVFALGSIGFGAFLVIANWGDYRENLLPKWFLARQHRHLGSLKRR